MKLTPSRETDPFSGRRIPIHPFGVCLGTATRKAVLVQQSGLSFHAPSHNGFADPLKAHSEPALIAENAPPALKPPTRIREEPRLLYETDPFLFMKLTPSLKLTPS